MTTRLDALFQRVWDEPPQRGTTVELEARCVFTPEVIGDPEGAYARLVAVLDQGIAWTAKPTVRHRTDTYYADNVRVCTTGAISIPHTKTKMDTVDMSASEAVALGGLQSWTPPPTCPRVRVQASAETSMRRAPDANAIPVRVRNKTVHSYPYKEWRFDVSWVDEDRQLEVEVEAMDSRRPGTPQSCLVKLIDMIMIVYNA